MLVEESSHRKKQQQQSGDANNHSSLPDASLYRKTTDADAVRLMISTEVSEVSSVLTEVSARYWRSAALVL